MAARGRSSGRGSATTSGRGQGKLETFTKAVNAIDAGMKALNTIMESYSYYESDGLKIQILKHIWKSQIRPLDLK